MIKTKYYMQHKHTCIIIIIISIVAWKNPKLKAAEGHAYRCPRTAINVPVLEELSLQE